MIKLTKMIGIIERCIIQKRTKEQKDIYVSSCQNPYFYILNRKGGLTQEELSKDLHINKSNVTRNIQSLSDNGYVKVLRDEKDKRVNRVYLDEKGKEVFPIIKASTKKCNELLLDGFTEEEVKELDKLLSKLVINAERMCNDENI